MNKHKVLVTEHLPEVGWEFLKKAEDIELTSVAMDRKTLLTAVKDVDAIIIRSKTIVDAELLEAGKNLRLVARAGAQYENIDIEKASRHGIMVMNVPDANAYAIVEHIFGLILALGRDLPLGVNSLRAGKWLRHEIVGFQLHGKTLGLIGYGRLGREIAIRAKSFGVNILAYDPYVDISLAREQGIEIVGFPEILERSDILSLQTTLSPKTVGIMNEEAFSQLKKGAYLINCVHAGLIDEEAMLKSLNEGNLSGVALDTFSQEPPPKNDLLINHPKVLATPHLNQNTVESQNETGLQVASKVLEALREEDFSNILNLPFNLYAPYKENKAYVHLAQQLGKLQGQTAEGQIVRVGVELIGEEVEPLMHLAAVNLLAGMRCVADKPNYNWVSAPILCHEQGLETVQGRNILDLPEYPNLMICKVEMDNGNSKSVAGILSSNGDAIIVHYNQYPVNALPEGNILILENSDVPGVIGKVGTLLGEANVNITNWRYGREIIGGKATSFITVDEIIPKDVLKNLEKETEIHRAKLVLFDN